MVSVSVIMPSKTFLILRLKIIHLYSLSCASVVAFCFRALVLITVTHVFYLPNSFLSSWRSGKMSLLLSGWPSTGPIPVDLQQVSTDDEGDVTLITRDYFSFVI